MIGRHPYRMRDGDPLSEPRVSTDEAARIIVDAQADPRNPDSYARAFIEAGVWPSQLIGLDMAEVARLVDETRAQGIGSKALDVIGFTVVMVAIAFTFAFLDPANGRGRWGDEHESSFSAVLVVLGIVGAFWAMSSLVDRANRRGGR